MVQSVDREQCTITNAEFMIAQLACRALAKRSIFAMFEFKMIGTIRPIAPGRSPGRASVSRALGRRFRVNRTEARVMLLFCNRQVRGIGEKTTFYGDRIKKLRRCFPVLQYNFGRTDHTVYAYTRDRRRLSTEETREIAVVIRVHSSTCTHRQSARAPANARTCSSYCACDVSSLMDV